MKRIARLLIFICVASAPLFALGDALHSAKASKGNYFVYVGTYTAQQRKGIYAYRFNATTRQLASLGLAAETSNPSFLAVHPSQKFLYAVNETGSFQNQKSGAVSAFAIDRRTGKLTLLNQVASRGADPCYVAVDKTGKYVLVANYSGGSVAVFPVLKGGRLGEATSVLQYKGAGANPERQEGPHAHWIDFSPDHRFAVVADEDGGNAERFDARPFGDEHRAGGIPRHVAAGFPRGAQATGREARRIGLALYEL